MTMDCKLAQRILMDNIVLIESNYDFEWEEKHILENFKSNALNVFHLCFDKLFCHKLVILDSASDGICCDHGNV